MLTPCNGRMSPFVWEKSTVSSAAALTTTANTKLSDDNSRCFDAPRFREKCSCVVSICNEFALVPAAGDCPGTRFCYSPDLGRPPLFSRRDSDQHHAVARHGCLELVFEVAQVFLPP